MSAAEIFYVCGIIALIKTLHTVGKSLIEAIKLYVFPGLVKAKPLQSYGKWAVITGGTDGVGKAIAKEMAKNGLKICFIARNESKVDKICQEIKDEFAVETRSIIADLSDISSYKSIETSVEEIEDIGILVNCAGIYTGSEVIRTDLKACLDLINTNVSASFWTIRIVAPKMIARRRGLIVNVGSIISKLLAPRAALYAASKSFLASLSESLEHELRQYNIRVKHIAPGFVKTKLTEAEAPSSRAARIIPWAYLTPESYASSVIASLKIDDSPREIIGNWYHWIYFWTNRMLLMGADNRPARFASILKTAFDI